MPVSASKISSGSHPTIGVNLRVTGNCSQGGRQYMEDVFSVAYQQTDDQKDLEFAFFGIFDGHGGKEAAIFAKKHLMDAVTSQKEFWSDDDDEVLHSIREGFLSTQQAMWKDRSNWRPTNSGYPSTAGTTASVGFIRRGKLFIGHCGDSGIVLGEEDPRSSVWRARSLTTDHKPESEEELARIEKAGGKVVSKSGVPRVVWYRPRGAPQGPVRRSTQIDEVPFLAVARALGDLWSYNPGTDEFVVSPEPDLHVIDLNIQKHRCLVLGTDGAWNVLSPEMAVEAVQEAEVNNVKHMISPNDGRIWINPSKKLVDLAIERWELCNIRADNTTIVCVMLDPPGPPRAQVIRRLHGVPENSSTIPPALPPKNSLVSRDPNAACQKDKEGVDLYASLSETAKTVPRRIVHDNVDQNDIRDHKTLIRSSQKKKSPSPPPLPEKPASLTGRKPVTNAGARKVEVKKEAKMEKPIVSSPKTTRPFQPVKKPRRSVLSEDLENQPNKNLRNHHQRSCMQLKGSQNTPNTPPPNRRSEPLLPAIPSRILRSRNNEEGSPKPPSLPPKTRRPSSNGTNNGNSQETDSAGVKRKRSSVEQLPAKLLRSSTGTGVNGDKKRILRSQHV